VLTVDIRKRLHVVSYLGVSFTSRDRKVKVIMKEKWPISLRAHFFPNRRIPDSGKLMILFLVSLPSISSSLKYENPPHPPSVSFLNGCAKFDLIVRLRSSLVNQVATIWSRGRGWDAVIEKWWLKCCHAAWRSSMVTRWFSWLMMNYHLIIIWSSSSRSPADDHSQIAQVKFHNSTGKLYEQALRASLLLYLFVNPSIPKQRAIGKPS
jgi:hypothetical protein